MDRTAAKVPVIFDENHRRALLECRDLSLVYFTAQLGEMHNNVNDILWDFADRAETNELQRRFIDAATTVTSGRMELEFAFRELISKGFSDFAAGRDISRIFQNLPQEYCEDKELELLTKNEIEEFVAIKNIVDKTKSNCYQNLYALGQRLSLIRGGVKVNDFNIPAGPLHTVYSFSKAVEAFDLSMDIKLVLFFLFEKYVMKEIDGVFEKYNECLINAGVFPNLKYVAPKVPSAESDKNKDEYVDDFMPSGVEEQNRLVQGMGVADRGASSGQVIAVSEEIFNSICNLLTMRRKNDPLFAQHPELNPNAPPVVMATKPALVAVIDEIQHAVSKRYTPLFSPAAHDDHASLINTAVLEQLHNRPTEEQNQLFEGVERRRIPSADLDTIEFVGMLFDYVLDDEELPNVVKALISHLHTPYLKVAILDQGFLVNDQHIARKLLNLMLEAGRKWVDENKLLHGAFYPMERQVDRILHEFNEDIALFEELLEDLTKDINVLEQKALSNEERSREKERGRDRLEAARMRATKVIEKHIGTRELPSVMSNFLFQVWMDRMTLLLLRNPHAEETPAWKRTLIIIDALLWALDAPKDKVKQQKLREIFPALKRRIEKYLSAVSDYYEPEAQALFDLLLEYQSDGVRLPGDDIHPEAVIEDEEIRQIDSLPDDSEEIELVGLTADMDSVDDTPVDAEDEIEFTDDEELIAKRLRISEFGTWFEILDDATGNPIQAKLSWYSPLSKRYMFVDHNGVQVAIRPLRTLVRELSDGTAHILEPPVRSFLEQAMSAIKEMLERATGAVKSVS